MDPLTVSAAAVGAYLSKDGVTRLLGPSADYLGGELKDLVQKSQRNLASVFQRAERKCGPKLEEDGAVNPRVLKHIYDEARFSDDDLLAEYFAGVLASSRTKDGKDDRGVYYSQIVKALSVYQTRMHYFFYYLMWLHSKGSSIDLNDYYGRQKLTLVVPASVYEGTFGVAEEQEEMGIITHSLAGLGPSAVSSLFTVVAEKLSYELLGAVKKEHLANFQEQNGVYIAHDSMGCPRYVGRGNVFNRLTARKKAFPDELTYFSYFIIKNRPHEREIETALIRAARFSLVLNSRKKRAGIASGDIRDFEAGTHYFERK